MLFGIHFFTNAFILSLPAVKKYAIISVSIDIINVSIIELATEPTADTGLVLNELSAASIYSFILLSLPAKKFLILAGMLLQQ